MTLWRLQSGMPPGLVFLSLFLGLISGPQSVDLVAGPEIKSIRILLDSHQVVELRGAPWHAVIDFGPSIAPGQLAAVGYDAHGMEVARVAQTINLPRPVAEFTITLQNNAKGESILAQFHWEHLVAAKPARMSLAVDGKPVSMDASARALLPRLSERQPHVITGEMRFEDGFVSRRELVIVGNEVATPPMRN
jgi:hypothetical protein